MAARPARRHRWVVHLRECTVPYRLALELVYQCWSSRCWCCGTLDRRASHIALSSCYLTQDASKHSSAEHAHWREVKARATWQPAPR
jgi:hypothetical protein